jgi:hypothetical protein
MRQRNKCLTATGIEKQVLLPVTFSDFPYNISPCDKVVTVTTAWLVFTLHMDEHLTKYCSGDKIEKIVMGGTCSADGERKGVYRVLVGECKGKRTLGILRPR